MDARIGEGSDYILALHDKGESDDSPVLSISTLSALSLAAHKRGKVFLVYVSGREQAGEAILAGADVLVAYALSSMSLSPRYYDRSVQKLAAARHVFVVPTITVLQLPCTDRGTEVLDDARMSPFLPPADISVIRRNLRMSAKGPCGDEENLRELHSARVTSWRVPTPEME